MNLLQELASTVSKVTTAVETGVALTSEASTIVSALEVDATQIKAGQPATISIPPISGSIEGVAGKFTGSVTFTPGA